MTHLDSTRLLTSRSRRPLCHTDSGSPVEQKPYLNCREKCDSWEINLQTVAVPSNLQQGRQAGWDLLHRRPGTLPPGRLVPFLHATGRMRTREGARAGFYIAIGDQHEP